MLTPSERRRLLEIARESIDSSFRGEKPQVDEPSLPSALRVPAGAFVTLRVDDDLRGCIGSILPDGPLYKAVSENARRSAFSDPRFPPLDRAEFGGVAIEISVMGPVTRVADLNQIQVGRDGLIIRMDRNAGLLLPQVATEYGWSRDEFLNHTCQKAGLDRSCWKRPGCTIEKFSAEVFAEDQQFQ